ncbi:lipase family protein [Xenorhabdus bovienii]|uniref:lipase family protein n=1 Tax=Xenorhabdus bovienii TaxID=40576 RepID=UPI0023B2E179|nr:lipase family protein [Xenorhabdus bovienii]MDE9431976.1 lipase family protein [Xenorhabdus bovienii]MDE9489702.1 lipase family protein [Xenorhabdus bovienii]MDE9505976.1 lipase family protein [Xenorhabdus bovienii]MDE9547704.1 lipase family protein [Xenorhabdus bovienii]
MSQLQPTDCIDCQKILKHWIEFQLVDEQGEPLAGMPYKLVSISNKKDVRTGVTNGEGLLREENLPPTPVRLWIDAQKLTDEMELRPLRTVRGPLGSKVKPKARTQGHFYRYIKIGDLCDKAPQIDNWNNKEELPKYHFPDNKFFGFKAAFVDARWILEVCPFRAWVLLLHHPKEYSLVNAYNQGLMSVLVYANANDNGNDETKEYSGSVFHFFKEQLLDLSRLPKKIEQKQFQPIVYDVPFRERYTRVEFIDTVENLNTQLFYVANNKELIVSWRGTAQGQDVLTDLEFKPIPLTEEYLNKGKAHQGFWQSFMAINNNVVQIKNGDKITRINIFDDIKKLAEDKNIFICGHSLGGALALLHSAQLRTYNPCLYTYGMPRVFTYSAVMEINNIIHYRHINQNDPVPTVPFEKDMDNPYFQKGLDYHGYYLEAMLLPMEKIFSEKTQKSINNMKSNEVFLHQGKTVHFYKSRAIEENVFILGEKYAEADFYLVPSLLSEESSEDNFFPLNKQPKKAKPLQSRLDLIYALDHLSGSYMEFIKKKIFELCIPKYHALYQEDKQKFENAIEFDNEYKQKLSGLKVNGFENNDDYPMHQYFLRLEQQLESTLLVSKKSEKGERALNYYIINNKD